MGDGATMHDSSNRVADNMTIVRLHYSWHYIMNKYDIVDEHRGVKDRLYCANAGTDPGGADAVSAPPKILKADGRPTRTQPTLRGAMYICAHTYTHVPHRIAHAAARPQP